MRARKNGVILPVLVGLLITGAGIWIGARATTQSTPDSVNIAMGGGLTVIGGAIFSYLQGGYSSRRSILEHVSEQVEAISTNLGQAATAINGAVQQGLSQQGDPTTQFQVISHSVNVVYLQINELQRLIGRSFDSRTLGEMLSALDVLAQQLARDPKGTSDELREDLERIIESAKGAPRAKTTESVACPHCGTLNAVSLGVPVGDTAFPRCASCELGFHVHRGRDGVPFTRMPGAQKAPL